MIAGWLEQCSQTNGIERGLTAASEFSRSLQDVASVARRKQMLQTIFKSITLSATGIKFEVRRYALTQRLLGASSPTSSNLKRNENHDAEDDAVVIERAMTIKRRGVEARIVINGVSQRNPDPALVDLIARAHLYLNRLTDGSELSIAELATQLRVHRADISRTLPLAFLSPAIIEAIVTGRQPADSPHGPCRV